MDTKTKVTMASVGVGTIVMVGAAIFAWQKSYKQRAKLADWKKRKIEDAYYASLDERDVAWG